MITGQVKPLTQKAGQKVVRVLIIEDDEENMLLLCEMLAEAGIAINVDSADRLQTGLKRLDNGEVDLILLDFDLPDSYGLDALEKLRVRVPDVPIIALISVDGEAPGAKARHNGAQDYLVKERLSSDLLTRSIGYVMEQQQMLTELKQHRQTLLVHREQLRHILEQNTDAIIIVDQEGIVRFANPSAESLLGCRTEQSMDGWFDFPIATGDNTEVELIRESGETIIAEVRVTEIEWEGEIAYLVLLRDVTQRSSRELQQFAYAASHDLQEPLSMITSYMQLLTQRYKGRLDADADALISYAAEGVNHIQTFLDDLLAYSRVSLQFWEAEYTDCEEAVDRALANLHPKIEESGAVVSCGALPIVIADRARLVQLFQNLISNAVKFHSEEPPRVRISAERRDNEWVFSIRDNGIGIDPEYTERIFIILQRLHSRVEYPGTGVGLAICKKIVERHGGRIWVESQPGKGSTFYFTIPLYEMNETARGVE